MAQVLHLEEPQIIEFGKHSIVDPHSLFTFLNLNKRM